MERADEQGLCRAGLDRQSPGRTFAAGAALNSSTARMNRINLKSVIIGGLVQPIDSLIPLFILLDFVYGIALVQLYAAIRPRFGPGPGTAVKAGIFVWVLITIVGLIEFPLAAVAGAKFYKEV